MNGYKGVINQFALNTLIKQPNIPDFHLMVGSAETLAPLPLLVYATAKIPKQIVNNMNDMSDKTSEEIAESIANNNLEVNDLNWNLAMLGSGLGV
jgi:hypothetical protein